MTAALAARLENRPGVRGATMITRSGRYFNFLEPDPAKPGDVLIDDWQQHRHRWIEMGGVFITHHDAETSLAALWAHYPALRPEVTS